MARSGYAAPVRAFLYRVLGVAVSATWGLGVIFAASGIDDFPQWLAWIAVLSMFVPFVGALAWAFARPKLPPAPRAFRGGILAGGFEDELECTDGNGA